MGCAQSLPESVHNEIIEIERFAECEKNQSTQKVVKQVKEIKKSDVK